MPERQPGVAQEAERQARLATDTSTAPTERSAERVEVHRADARELRALDVASDRLHGIQLWGIVRQALDGQPRALARQVGAHHATLMGRESVPDEDHRLSPDVTAEVPQERERPIGVVPRLSLKEEPSPAPIPPEGTPALQRERSPRASETRRASPHRRGSPARRHRLDF